MRPWPPLHLVGLTHRKADLDVRERFARSRAEIVALLTGEQGPRRSGVVLSTCNRFEVYWYGERDWPAWLRDTAARDGAPLQPAALIRWEGDAAARHLFRVTAGLDAQVVGETEVLGQVHQAWSLARDVGASGRELDIVFASALAAGRRVRREAALGGPPLSIASVAVGLAEREVGGFQGRSVLIIGAGEAARGIAAALDGRGARVTVVARHHERSAALALEYPVTVGTWNQLEALLGAADVAFSAAAAPEPILSVDQVGGARRRGAAPLWLIDLGVPRNVDLAVRRLPGVHLRDLDDLRTPSPAEATEGSLALDVAHRIVEEEVTACIGRLRGLSASARLADLHRLGARIAEEEVSRALAELPSLAEPEREALQRMANRVARRVLFPASRALRDLPGVEGASELPAEDRERGIAG